MICILAKMISRNKREGNMGSSSHNSPGIGSPLIITVRIRCIVCILLSSVPFSNRVLKSESVVWSLSKLWTRLHECSMPFQATSFSCFCVGDGIVNQTNWHVMLQTTARENMSRTCKLASYDFDRSLVIPRWQIIVDSFEGHSRPSWKNFGPLVCEYRKPLKA